MEEQKTLDFEKKQIPPATIKFTIPEYVDKNTGETFERTIQVSSKKAYAIFKKTMEKFTPDSEGRLPK
jgi:hypothetical protein